MQNKIDRIFYWMDVSAGLLAALLSAITISFLRNHVGEKFINTAFGDVDFAVLLISMLGTVLAAVLVCMAVCAAIELFQWITLDKRHADTK